MKTLVVSAIIALGVVVAAERPAATRDVNVATYRADPLLEVLGCGDADDCRRKDNGLKAERRACLDGVQRACNVLHALHRVACTLPSGEIDRDAESCHVHLKRGRK